MVLLGTPPMAQNRPGTSRPDSAECPQSTPYGWYVTGLLAVVSTVALVHRQIISFLIDPIKAELSVSDNDMGLLIGPWFAVFYTVCGVLLSRLADYRSRRALIGLSCVAWSLMTTLSGTVQSFMHLFIARMGVGLGQAILNPAAYSLIADYFPRRKLATAISFYEGSAYIGSGLAFLLGGVLLDKSESWRMVFWLVGVPGVVVSLTLITVRERPRTTAGASGGKDASFGDVLGYLWKSRRVLLTHHLALSALAFSGYGTFAWIPTFFTRHHQMSRSEAGIVLAISAAVGGVAGTLCAGYLADRLGARGRVNSKMLVALLASVLWLPAGVAYVLVENAWLAASLYCVAQFFGAGPFGVAAALVQELMPAQMRARGAALYLFVVNLIGFGLGPAAVSFVTDHIFQNEAWVGYSLLLCGLAARLFAVPVLFLSSRHYEAAMRRGPKPQAIFRSGKDLS